MRMDTTSGNGGHPWPKTSITNGPPPAASTCERCAKKNTTTFLSGAFLMMFFGLFFLSICWGQKVVGGGSLWGTQLIWKVTLETLVAVWSFVDLPNHLDNLPSATGPPDSHSHHSHRESGTLYSFSMHFFFFLKTSTKLLFFFPTVHCRIPGVFPIPFWRSGVLP